MLPVCPRFARVGIGIHLFWLSSYIQALQALSHALLLAPQNPFTFLQFAETAFTAGDIPLALKNFLIVIDMNDSDISVPQDQSPAGISVRAWWGVKLVRRLGFRAIEDLGLMSSPFLVCPPTVVSSCGWDW